MSGEGLATGLKLGVFGRARLALVAGAAVLALAAGGQFARRWAASSFPPTMLSQRVHPVA